MDNASQVVLRRRLGFVSAAPFLAAVASCSPAADASADPSGPPIIGLTALESPAAEGSGEPFLSLSEDGPVLSWLEEQPDGAHALRMSVLGSAGWSPARTIAARSDFFVNWADFPSVVEVSPGLLVAHWLQRGGAGTYDYGVRVVRSRDGGVTWSEPWTPHEDDTPTEHGFVSIFPGEEGAWGLVWLDGRQYVASDGVEASNEMTLRFRQVAGDGAVGEEVVIDPRVCDCCQTTAVLTSAGPLVAYRDRSEMEIRDISVTRLIGGRWTEGAPVHRDEWHINACPVNGPKAAARADAVALAWFTGAGDIPHVKVAFSADAGETFGEPLVIDEGNPAGRVDVVLLADGSAVVSWLERSDEGDAEVRVRRVWPNGRTSLSEPLTRSSGARSSGFPRMLQSADGTLVFAWTDVADGGTRVKVARAEVPAR